jgi:hypothetical protein
LSLMVGGLYAGTELCWVSRNRSGMDSARVRLWEQSGNVEKIECVLWIY